MSGWLVHFRVDWVVMKQEGVTLTRFGVKGRFVASKERLSWIETLTPSLTPWMMMGRLLLGVTTFIFMKTDNSSYFLVNF